MSQHDQKLHNLNQALISARARGNQQRVKDLLRLIEARNAYLDDQARKANSATADSPVYGMYAH